jgi:hypothetical protein
MSGDALIMARQRSSERTIRLMLFESGNLLKTFVFEKAVTVGARS